MFFWEQFNQFPSEAFNSTQPRERIVSENDARMQDRLLALTPMAVPKNAVPRSCSPDVQSGPSKRSVDPVTVPNVHPINSLSAQVKPENPSREKHACGHPR